MARLTLGEIAERVNGVLAGDSAAEVAGVAPLDRAGPEELSFVANPRYLPYVQGTRAGVLLVPGALLERVPEGIATIAVDDAHLALYHVLPLLHPPEPVEPGIHATSAVAPDAVLGDGVFIGPFAVVEQGVQIGAGTRVGAHTVVGRGAVVGRDCVIHPQATLYAGVVLGDRCIIHSGARIGKEGFGFVWHEGGHRKLPQVGGCVLGNDVEVGCNTTIDRGSVGDTVVGDGTKIDNLVQLGHNDRIGRHVILISQVGISGSTTIGDGAVLAGQVGVGGHLTVGAGAKLGGQAGVIADVPDGVTYSGYPARPHREAMRAQGFIFRLAELFRRVRAVEDRLGMEKDSK
jgi:UDP-3-O-[3-hydroxymyristoyl] glucosamine N-acyltransferase